MGIVDQRIGEVLAALPKDVAQNTIIVFCSDHGEYAGAHGFVAGKIGSCYEEPFHIPLIVVDPSGRFTGDIDTVRTGLTSSVDMLTFLVSLGHNGSRAWMTGPLAEIYGGRHDMVSMLLSASAPGRPYVLLATDEIVPGYFFYNGVPPLHVAAIRTQDAKLGTYSSWNPITGQIEPASTQLEFYDYNTQEGRLELANTPQDPRAQPLANLLLNNLLPNELRAPLPGQYGAAQTISKAAWLLFNGLILKSPGNGEHLGGGPARPARHRTGVLIGRGTMAGTARPGRRAARRRNPKGGKRLGLCFRPIRRLPLRAQPQRCGGHVGPHNARPEEAY